MLCHQRYDTVAVHVVTHICNTCSLALDVALRCITESTHIEELVVTTLEPPTNRILCEGVKPCPRCSFCKIVCMGRRCPYVCFDKANNCWIARRRSCVKKKKVFSSFVAAERYALTHLVSDTPRRAPLARQRMVMHLQSLSKIYGHQQLLPADLQDAMARHVCDSDVFQAEPAAEVLSIMLKYRPARTVFSNVLRMRKHRVKVSAVSVSERAERLWQCLRQVAIELAKCGAKVFALIEHGLVAPEASS